MSYPVPETWNVSGILSNNGVPFCEGKIEAYHRLADGTLDWMAECGIGEDGSFSLEFSSYMFQKGNTSIDHPDLVIRLFDFAGNLLWESDTYAATETPFLLGKIDISQASADDVWNIEGFVFYNSVTPFGAGTVFVYDLWNGLSTLLSQASLNAKGYFSCSYLKSAFQKQGATRTAPALQVVVRDLQGQSLATYDVPNPVSVRQVVRIRLDTVPGVLTSDACRVFGNIKNPLGYPLQDDIEVAAFCLYYRESVDDLGAKIGIFEKVMLGNPIRPDAFGHYEIVYNASSIPLGLKLDGKIAKGKDKASLFAEVHYKNGGDGNDSDSPRSFYSAPLVFNGKSAQEINFVLDLETDKPIESEFERLDNILKIYYQTVISYKETIKVSRQDKISEFLDSVTRFPLVIGREDVDEAKARAYFKSFQIAHELVDSVEGLRGALASGATLTQEEFQAVSVCAAYLYPLIRNAKVFDVSTLLATGLDECKKVIQEAISANLVSSKLSADEFRLKIWNYLQKSKNVATEQENTFSAFFVFYLFLAKELELESNKYANAGSIKKSGKGGRPKLTRLGELQERLDSLLDLFSDCGSNYQELIASLKDSSMFSSAEVEDLKFLIELGDFCNWYPDLVVSAYTLLHKENSPYKPCAKPDSQASEADLLGAWKLEYLLKYGNVLGSEPDFWRDTIERTAERYACWCREISLALPLDLFPGTTANEQKQIAIRTLKERLRAKFPQTELKLKLSETFAADDAEKPWKDLIGKLQSEPWADFDLNASDLEMFLKKSAEAHAQGDRIPEATASDDEKEKIKILQRLFRLTNDPQAVAYLVRNGFDSASKIALSDEESFVAKHGLGMGDKELATNIHRLAKNFVANATLDVERYHGNLNESDNAILSLPRGLQNESSSMQTRSSVRNARSVGNNVAKRRLQNKDYANWKTLFGSINRNSVTQNQSILSPSAYLLDLLEFLKQGQAYTKFINRRPDVLALKMTKANAEISLPTIDLAIELLESLVARSSTNQKAVPFCNQTPEKATVEDLRANPCPWISDVSVSEMDVEATAMKSLGEKIYPMSLPQNFDRMRVSEIFANLSLDESSVARKLRKVETENAREDAWKATLLLKGHDPKLLSSNRTENSHPVWELWGLTENDNEGLFFPDKSRQIESKNRKWHRVLSCLAFVLDRAQLTYEEFAEILTSPVFEDSGVTVHADSESFQLSDVGGYRILVAANADEEDFFFKLSVFIRRRMAFGWNIDDVAKTWNCQVDELAEIQELKTRIELSVQEAAVLLGKCSLTRDALKKIFPIDSLFDAYAEEAFANVSALDLAKECDKLLYSLSVAANVCLGMDSRDAVLLLQEFWKPTEERSLVLAFEDGLKILYRYGLWIAKNKLSVEDYLFLKRIGFPVEWGGRKNCNETIDELELLRGSSLSVGDLKAIFEPQLIPSAESSSFAVEFNANVRKSLDEFDGVDYETAIHGLLKTLGKENAGEIFDAWKNDFEPDVGGKRNACLKDVLRYVSEPSPSWKEVFAADESGTAFYNALRDELVFERSLSLIAEKFSMTSNVVAKLFEKLKDDALDDLAEWKSFAIRENITSIDDWSEDDIALIEILCNRIVRCSALYRFTQSLDLGFEWDWKNLIPPAERRMPNVGESEGEAERTPYGLFEDVLCAFAASSRILGEVYNYGELENLDALDEKIRISNDAFEAILAASEIDFERDGNSLAVTSLEMNSPFAWCRFAELLSLYRKTNTLPADLKNLLDADDASYSEPAKTFEENLKLARTNSEWNRFIQGVNDKIRQLKRDALAAVVCNESQMPATAGNYPAVFVDESDIYSYYLLDVKMESDMAISRTVQAVSCIQLYVQRALMGLEGGYTLNDTQREQWEWMKNFQVWVANRKVFLYPENWIDGDLRSDKTPFFVELEDRLAEAGNDQEAMTEALGEYLKKVCDTSEIDIVGACKQDGGSVAGVLYTLHIVGRTRGEPHTYYYRKYEATALYGGNWTPWEEIPVEIDGAAIQPAILGGHLYITWLQVVQGQKQKKTGETGGKQAAVSVEYYAELRLKWTAFTGAKWTGVKVGKQAVYDVSENQLDFILGENESLAERYFVIDVSDNSDVLNLQVWRTFPDFVDTPHVVTVPVANSAPLSGDVEGLDNAPATTYILKTEVSREYRADQRINHIGNFSLAQDGSDTASNQVEPITGNPIAFTYGEFVKNHSPAGCRLVGNLFHNAGGSLVLQDGTKIFGNTRGPFKLLSVNMGFICHEDRPFFYMDSKGIFLVRTVSGDGGSGANSIPNYHVEMVSNPQAGEFRRRFLQGGPKWLYSRETEALPVSDSYYYSYSYYNYYFSVYLGYYTAGDWQAWDLSQTLFEHGYLPGNVVAEPYPSSTVDFCWGSATSIYNWELFFFVPMLLADRMLAEQNYEAALNWLQLVFDPRIDLTPYERTKRFVRELSKGAKYWKFLPFFANLDADRSILSELSFPTPHDALPDRKAIQLLIDRWKNDPFNPQMIARYRPVAYQKYVVMKYLDALIGWGDLLFSQDTTESVNLAVQMYILAAEILGPKSAEVPDPKNATAFSVRDLMAKSMGVMNNAFVTYEDTMLTGKSREKETPQRLLPGKTMQLAHTTGMMFYFNVPRNETLAGYWDTVADRLYKIRNSLNIEGVKRTLALFAPPIDPALLVKAKANGISISEALADASSALPYYRFKVMVAKAIEIVRDVMQMGRDLLDILEKYDAESLAVLRASHERTMLALQKTVTDMDVAELEKELESVETEQENAAAEQAEQEEYYRPIKLEDQYDRFMEKARKVQETVENVKKAASVAYKIPDLDIGAIANGLGGPSFSALSAGGTKIAENLVNEAESYASRFVQRQVSAAKMKLQAEAERRLQDWTMAKTEKANRAKTLEKKKAVAEIRIDYARKQVEKAEREIELKDEMYDHLSEKYTNKELYGWLKKEAGSAYKSLFQLAVKVARKAEKCYHFEIGDIDIDAKSSKTFIKGCGSYWDGLHSGLLAGEKLLADLHVMEVAYLENDRNELEITRPVSLTELVADDNEDLSALQFLIENMKTYISTNKNDAKIGNSRGFVKFTILRNFFVNDFAQAHKFERIRDVRLQVVCSQKVQLNVELNMESNSLYVGQKKSVENRIGVQNMATSMAVFDCGKYNFDFKKDKFSQFEGAGVESTWNLYITGPKSFDPDSITDVVIFISYTARNE